MTKYNKEFYQSEDGYSDGELESELYLRISNGEKEEEILKKDSRWPVYYHLSPKRENILSWYPFRENASILEVGSGLGALTGLLSERAEDLTSVELTEDRARVNLARHPDKENLEIYVGNLMNMDFGKKYDYVILNGVLEYAGSFSDSETPYEDFLNTVKSHLKPDGTLLIAIENRLGLKYFNGVTEDHTAKLFSGIDGYVDVENVKTFSRGELDKLLENTGFSERKFYYPNPDYKFAETIYTDETVDLADTRVETDVYNIDRVRFFDESEVMRSLLEEGILEHFFNSFLVEARLNAQSLPSETIYAKISDERKPEFETITTIVREGDKKYVKKSAATKKAKAHLEKMRDYYASHPTNKHYTNVPFRETDSALLFDYIEGETLEKVLLEDIKNGETERFKERLIDFKEELLSDTELRDDYYQGEFIDYFGETPLHVPLHVMKGSNLDLIFTNIIVSDKDYIIDYEWITDFDLPQEFVIWRALYYFYLSNLKTSSYTIEDLMEIVGLDPKLGAVFKAWDEHFGNRFIRRDENLKKRRTIDAVPLLTELIGAQDKYSSLYLDFGEGESEENRILSEVEFDGEDFEVSFDLTPILEKNAGRLKRIRWDPLERACKIENVRVEGDLLAVCPDETLASQILLDDAAVFLEDDPHMLLLGDYAGIDEIKISGTVKFLDSAELMKIVNELKKRRNSDKEQLDYYREAVYDKDRHIENLENLLAKNQIPI